MYNYCALWIRAIWIVIFALLCVLVILVSGKKLKQREKIILSILALCFIVLSGITTIKGLIKPEVGTIFCYYDGPHQKSSASPFGRQYCFINGREKILLDIDPFSKSKIFRQEFIKGKEYIISYEKNTNLIVAVQSKNK